MSEMIERVAIALYNLETTAAREQFPQFAAVDGQWGPLIGESGKNLFRSQARAAIEAMREPTDAMCDAADWGQQSEVNQYQRAIDAALGKVDA
jgi:hypothetical protein